MLFIEFLCMEKVAFYYLETWNETLILPKIENLFSWDMYKKVLIRILYK